MKKNTENVILKLQSLEQNKCDLSTLRKLIPDSSYDEFFLLIKELEQYEIIAPVKASGQNGQNPPLYIKYHIIPPKTDNSTLLKEIDSLHYWIDAELFRKYPDRYKQNHEFLYTLSEFLKLHAETLNSPMSENERSYAIWGNEKMLDNNSNITLLKKCGVWERLNTYPTPEPFFEYRRNSVPSHILVIENKDPWFTMRKLMLESEVHSFYDIPIDCLLYGEGNKITKKAGSLEQYLNQNGNFQGTIYYWGDLDPEGIGFYLSVRTMNEKLQIQPFLPAYLEMIRLFEQRLLQPHNDTLYRISKQQKYPTNPKEFYQFFPDKTLQSLMEGGYYIPQEILNYQLLKLHSR